jgi:hypothetical protein
LQAHLAELSERGLMWQHDDLVARIAGAAALLPTASIALVGIPTHHRATLLDRAVGSYVEAQHRAGRSHELVVVEDGATDATRRVAAKHDTRFANDTDKLVYAQALAQEARVDPHLIAFALGDPHDCGYAVGVQRNAIALDAIGRAYATADDDTTAELTMAGDAIGGVSLTSKFDPLQLDLHVDVPTAIAAGLPRLDEDPIALHESLLGRPIGNIVASCQPGEEVEIDGASTTLLASAAAGGGLVRITMLGVVGSSGFGTAGGLLALDGEVREQLIASYLELRTTRAVFRRARRATLAAPTVFMTGAAGFDGRALLPPFFPVRRNADGVFATMLWMMDPDAICGHLPRAVRHEPAVVPVSDREGLVGDVDLRISEALMLCIAGCPISSAIVDPPARLAALGTHLTALAASPSRLDEFLRVERMRQLGVRAHHLHLLVDKHHREPVAWARDIESAQAAIRAALRSNGYATPRDLPVHDDTQALRLATTLIGDYGRLCIAWPEIDASARRLEMCGVRVSRPARADELSGHALTSPCLATLRTQRHRGPPGLR